MCMGSFDFSTIKTPTYVLIGKLYFYSLITPKSFSMRYSRVFDALFEAFLISFSMRFPTVNAPLCARKKAWLRLSRKLRSPTQFQSNSKSFANSVPRFGKNSQLCLFLMSLAIFAGILSIAQDFESTLEFLMLLGKFSLLKKAKFWTNNLAIWPHWLRS